MVVEVQEVYFFPVVHQRHAVSVLVGVYDVRGEKSLWVDLVRRLYLASGELGEEAVRIKGLVDFFDDVVVELVFNVLLVQRFVVCQEYWEGVLPAAVQTDRVL